MNIKSRSNFNIPALLALVAALLASALSAAPAQASGTVYRVVPAGMTSGTCDTWSNGCTLPYTLTLATVLGDQVWVKAGVYTPGASTSDAFNILSDQAVYGGFNGTESSLGERNPRLNVTILSGDIGGDDDSSNADGNFIDETYLDIAGNNSFHVLYMDGHSTLITTSTVLDGFTITGGDGIADSSFGGGLLCYAGTSGACSPTLSALTFSGNQAQFAGALMNQATGGGNSSPTLTDVTFQGNYAIYGGGAIYNWGSNTGNSSPTLTNVTFSGNSAPGGKGGAIWNDGADGNSSAMLTNVTFQGNSAGSDGGAIFGSAGTTSGTNSPTLTNVTFQGNNAGSNGGAIFSSAGSGGTSSPTLTNVILWGNSAGVSGNQMYNDGATPTIDYSVVQGGDSGSNSGTAFSSGTNNLSTDPLLAPLADRGGSMKTMALLAGSSAIDTADDASCPPGDQRGVTRPQGPHCDIGAFETRLGTTTVAYRSLGAQDGWLLESSETSGKASTSDSAATQFTLGDDAAKKQYRGILSFDTSALPDDAVITAVTLKIKKTGLVGANPFGSLGNIIVDIKKGFWSGNAALQLTDFYAAGSKNYAAQITNSPVSSWYSTAFGSSSLGYTNLTGPTQIRLRFATDDNNNLVADYLKFGSGNAVTSSRPVLTITFYVP